MFELPDKPEDQCAADHLHMQTVTAQAQASELYQNDLGPQLMDQELVHIIHQPFKKYFYFV